MVASRSVQFPVPSHHPASILQQTRNVDFMICLSNGDNWSEREQVHCRTPLVLLDHTTEFFFAGTPCRSPYLTGLDPKVPRSLDSMI